MIFIVFMVKTDPPHVKTSYMGPPSVKLRIFSGVSRQISRGSKLWGRESTGRSTAWGEIFILLRLHHFSFLHTTHTAQTKHPLERANSLNHSLSQIPTHHKPPGPKRDSFYLRNAFLLQFHTIWSAPRFPNCHPLMVAIGLGNLTKTHYSHPRSHKLPEPMEGFWQFGSK